MRIPVISLFTFLACTQQVSVGGAQPLGVDRETLDFGKVRLTASRELEVTLTNPSTKGLEVEGFVENDRRSAFSVRTVGFSLAGGASKTVAVRYTAPGSAAFDAAILVLKSPGLPDISVSLEGEAVRVEAMMTGPMCGDGTVDTNETCDPPGSCLTTCASDNDACTTDVLSGTAATCDVVCQHRAITTCVSNDGCCPSNCMALNDNDCTNCGNGRVDFGEICDGASCPTSCAAPNACTTGTLMGSAAACDARCTFTPVTACLSGDGCCPSGCAGPQDMDCGVCGDGTCSSNETCGSCLQDCGVPTLQSPAMATCTLGGFTLHRTSTTCSTELIVLGVYQGTPTINAQNIVRVNIKRTTPMVLVLSAYAATRWDIVAAVPGTQIRKVIVSGYEDQQTSLIGPNNWAMTDFVTRFPYTSNWLGCGFEYPGQMMPGECITSSLITAAEQLSGSRLSLYAGCYEASSFTIE